MNRPPILMMTVSNDTLLYGADSLSGGITAFAPLDELMQRHVTVSNRITKLTRINQQHGDSLALRLIATLKAERSGLKRRISALNPRAEPSGA
jgi:hypothetical protein